MMKIVMRVITRQLDGREGVGGRKGQKFEFEQKLKMFVPSEK